MYTWDWNVDYKAQNREKCKNCKHCWIGFPIKIVGCDKMMEQPKEGICKEFIQRKTQIEEINELKVINLGKGIPNERNN